MSNPPLPTILVNVPRVAPGPGGCEAPALGAGRALPGGAAGRCTRFLQGQNGQWCHSHNGRQP